MISWPRSRILANCVGAVSASLAPQGKLALRLCLVRKSSVRASPASAMLSSAPRPYTKHRASRGPGGISAQIDTLRAADSSALSLPLKIFFHRPPELLISLVSREDEQK